MAGATVRRAERDVGQATFRRSRQVRLRAMLVLGATFLLCVVADALPAPAAADQASEPTMLAAGQLDAGSAHTCAALSGDSLRCWGFSGDGQLGYGNTDTIGDDEPPPR